MIKTIKARFNGRCAVSGAPIRAGDDVLFDTVTRKTWYAEPGDFEIVPASNGSYMVNIESKPNDKSRIPNP
jgi:hypothetical protein